MNTADQRALAHLKFDVPFSDEDYRLLGDCTAVGQAALLFSTDNTALVEWYERPTDTPSAITRVLSLAVDRDDVIDRIDSTLADDPTILEDLVRSRVMWTHPELPGLLDRAEFRTAAVWHLVHNDPDIVADWLVDERSLAQVGAIARDIAFADGVELFDLLAEWMGQAADSGDRWGCKLEAALFALSPNQWARGYLGGMWDARFFDDWVAMADIASLAPPGYWTAPLARLRRERDEFALMARLASAGAAAMLSMSPDEPLERIVQAFDAEEWEAIAKHPLFATPLALADDDDLQIPLLESAVHDVLTTAGIDSPGIAGLPLSTTAPSDDSIAAAAELLAEFEDRQQLIPVVATLCDIAALRAAGDERTGSLDDVIRQIAQADHAASETARDLIEPPSIDQLAHDADGLGIEHVAAAEQLAMRTMGDAPTHLIELWANGPLLRSTLYSTLVQMNLTAITIT